jgi:hypothetical protein
MINWKSARESRVKAEEGEINRGAFPVLECPFVQWNATYGEIAGKQQGAKPVSPSLGERSDFQS